MMLCGWMVAMMAHFGVCLRMLVYFKLGFLDNNSGLSQSQLFNMAAARERINSLFIFIQGWLVGWLTFLGVMS